MWFCEEKYSVLVFILLISSQLIGPRDLQKFTFLLKQDRTNFIQTIRDISLFNLYLQPSGMAISTTF